MLNDAMQMARDSGRATPTSEQLLLVLLDDETVKATLARQYVDVESVRIALEYYLETANLESDAPENTGDGTPFQNVMRRAALKNAMLNKRGIALTDVLIAILVEGDSYAAQILGEHGLTADDAENAALEAFLAAQEDQAQRNEEMRVRIAEQNARQAASGSMLAIESGVVRGSPAANGPRFYTLRVTSEDSENDTQFKAAVSHDGRLDLHIESTPFETEFLASRIAALFEAIDTDGRLNVELITEIDGQRRIISGFGGRSGAIFDDRTGMSSGQRSGTL